MIRFNMFHLMGWPHLTETPRSWPVPNRLFDPKLGQKAYNEYIEQMALADELGFDWVGCNEHHFSPFGLQASPTVMGGALTQRISRAKIAMLGSLVPLNNPVRLAEEYAMLDVMSGGRFIAGFIRGTPHEPLAYNVNPDESRARFEEACQLIVKCWTEPEPFGWEGRYYRYRTVSIWPRPMQQPHPSVFMSAGSEQSASFAARMKFGLGVAFLPMFRARQLFDVYEQAAAENGWTPGPDKLLYDHFIYVHPDREVARRTVQESVGYFLKNLVAPNSESLQRVIRETTYLDATERKQLQGPGPEKMEKRFSDIIDIDQQIAMGMMSVGTPEEVVEQLKKVIGFTRVGILNTEFHLGTLTHEQTCASMRLFMKEVFPHVRDLDPAAAPRAA